ncbi:MAG: phosphoglycerate kinase [Patescibacteria group bacterium]
MKSIKEADVKGKKVLMRCEFNVPLDENGKILDDYDLRRTIPTIEYLVKREARLILMSHLDSPGGKVVENLRLTPVQERLFGYLDMSISKAPDCIGTNIKEMVDSLIPGEVLLLENLRFHEEEEENDEDFAKELSSLGDIFVNEAFGVCHRAHASIVGVPKHLPSYAGLLLEEEVRTLGRVMESPGRPLVAIFGGAKAETKIPAIKKFLEIADSVLVGGKISLELEEMKMSHRKLVLPEDYNQNFDIGDKTIKKFKEVINEAATIVWNGPMGYLEKEEFEKGTREIAKAIAESKAFKVAGGGETSLAIEKYGIGGKIDFVSIGGGAMLQFLAGDRLPGLEVLSFYQ